MLLTSSRTLVVLASVPTIPGWQDLSSGDDKIQMVWKGPSSYLLLTIVPDQLTTSVELGYGKARFYAEDFKSFIQLGRRVLTQRESLMNQIRKSPWSLIKNKKIFWEERNLDNLSQQLAALRDTYLKKILQSVGSDNWDKFYLGETEQEMRNRIIPDGGSEDTSEDWKFS